MTKPEYYYDGANWVKYPEPKVPTCECGAPGSESHPCPFKEEMSGDSETLCNCCTICEHECFTDI